MGSMKGCVDSKAMKYDFVSPSANHASPRNNNKDWLAEIQDNVSE
jgi:hypothetical protein